VLVGFGGVVVGKYCENRWLCWVSSKSCRRSTRRLFFKLRSFIVVSCLTIFNLAIPSSLSSLSIWKLDRSIGVRALACFFLLWVVVTKVVGGAILGVYGVSWVGGVSGGGVDGW
jgi:hypothetical protein